MGPLLQAAIQNARSAAHAADQDAEAFTPEGSTADAAAPHSRNPAVETPNPAAAAAAVPISEHGSWLEVAGGHTATLDAPRIRTETSAEDPIAPEATSGAQRPQDTYIFGGDGAFVDEVPPHIIAAPQHAQHAQHTHPSAALLVDDVADCEEQMPQHVADPVPQHAQHAQHAQHREPPIELSVRSGSTVSVPAAGLRVSVEAAPHRAVLDEMPLAVLPMSAPCSFGMGRRRTRGVLPCCGGPVAAEHARVTAYSMLSCEPLWL